MKDVRSKSDALEFLKSLEVPRHLLVHTDLVGEAGEDLIRALRSVGLGFDQEFVRVGIVLHDSGKITHPNELFGGGSEHEPEGERLLLAYGVEPRLARVCLSHARWATMDCSFEELLIALADKLWKGVRGDELERLVMQRAADQLGKDFWELFETLDTAFERIADRGHERLERSRTD